jgi:hypothetical protein
MNFPQSLVLAIQAVRVDIKSMKVDEEGGVKEEEKEVTEMELCAPGTST